MAKKKPSGLSFLDKQNKELYEMKVCYLNVEKTESVKYYPTFSVNKIDDVIEELTLSILKCKEENIDFLKSDEDIIKYAHYLIIKHFTEFKDFLSQKDIYENIAYLHKMYDNGWFDLFIKETFEEIEIQKVIDKIYDIEAFVGKYQDELLKRKEIIEKNVTNEVLKEYLNKKIN